MAAGVGFVALSKGIEQAAEGQSTMHELEAAIRRTGAAAEEAGPRIEAAIQHVFKASAFDDEPLRKASALFVTITGNAEAAAQAIGPVADLSAALGVDLDSAARMVAKATEGQVTALQRAGIIFTDTERKMLETADAGTRLEAVLGKINEKVGGAAAAELDTYNGQVKEFKKQWDEVAQSFGSIFLPAAQKVVGVLADIAKGIKAVIDGARNDFANAPANGVAGGISNIERIAAKGGRAPQTSGISDEDLARLDETVKRMTAVAQAKAAMNLGSAGIEALGLAAGLKAANDQIDKLAREQALAKLAPEIEAARQKAAAFAQDAKDFELKIQMTFRKPPDGDIEAAVREVEDKVADLLKDTDTKARGLVDTIATARAEQVALRAELLATDQTDVGKIATLQAQIAAREQIVNAAKDERTALDAGRREIEAQGAAARQIALDDALAKAADKALAEYGKVQDKVKQIGADARAALAGLVGSGQFASQIDQATANAQNQITLSFGFSPEFRQGIQDATAKMQKGIVDGAVAGAKETDQRIRQAFDDSSQTLAHAITEAGNVLGDIFTDLFYTGGQNFGQIAGKMFQDAIKSGSKLLAEAIGKGAGGVIGNSLDRSQFGSELEYQTAVQQRTTDALNAAVSLTGLFSQLAAAGSGVNNPRQQPVGTVVGTTLAGASAGASIAGIVGASTAAGGIIGAIVGLIIGGLMLALAPAVGKSYPYATTGVKGGEAFFDPTQNISDNERKAALAKLQSTYDQFWNGYVDILTKLPSVKLEGVLKDMGDISPTLGIDQPGGDIGHAANKDFWTQFNNWVDQGMPRELASKFTKPLQDGFGALGISAGKFQEIWNHLDKLDPHAALQALSQLADAMKAIGESTAYFNLPTSGGPGGTGLIETARADLSKTFAEALADGDKDIVRLGESLNELTGAEQIARLQQISQLEDERMAKEKQFLEQVVQTIDGINSSIDSRQREIDLALMKGPDGKANVQGQIDYLKNYADTLLQKIGTAKSPEEVARLEQESQSVLARITALGGNTDEYLKWEKDQLETLRKASTDALEGMAADVEKQNKAFTDAIQGFIDAFRDATNQLQAAPPPPTIPPGTHPGGPPGPGDDIPGHRPNWYIPHVGGDVPDSWVDWWDTQPWKGNSGIPDWGWRGGGNNPPTGGHLDPNGNPVPIPNPGGATATSDVLFGSSQAQVSAMADKIAELERSQKDGSDTQADLLRQMLIVLKSGQFIDLGELTVNLQNAAPREATSTVTIRAQAARAGARA